VHGLIADGAGGAWTFGGSILTVAFPLILFIVVAGALYVLYTKPEFVPGHRAPGVERPVSYTAVPGKPTVEARAQAQPAGEATPASAGEATPASASEATPASAGEATPASAGEAAPGEAARTEGTE
jgi:hypothetical protein